MAKRLDSEEERRRLERFVCAILGRETEADVLRDLTELSVPMPYRLRMKVLYSRHSIRQVCVDRTAGDELNALSNDGPGFRLKGIVGRKNRRKVRVDFAVLSTDWNRISVLLSVSTSEQWQFLRRWIGNRYPTLVPIYLSQKELIAGARSLRDQSAPFTLRVKELTAREAIAGRGTDEKSVREWTDGALQDVLVDVTDRHQVLTSLKLAFYKTIDSQVDVSPSVLAKITKDGEVEISGRFELAWQTVVQHVSRVGSEKLRFFSQRGLRERQYRSAPLEIRFSTSVFEAKEEAHRLVDVLRDYPHSMHSVQHGNPYVHMQIADVYDGSSFDIWAVSDKSLVLMPRLKTTEAAFERLIHYVFDEFREGDVVEYADA